MTRFGIIALTAFLLFTGAEGQAQPTYRVQEGFPAAEMARLTQRSQHLTRALGLMDLATAQGLIIHSRIWLPQELPLTVAFLGGTPTLRAQIVSAASTWSQAANVQFDFGPPGTYREWTRNDTTYAARIRIAFDEEGYWSFVGSDSIDVAVAGPNQASMNFQDFTNGLPPDWQGVVLHEFGHAIGFEHEHQSPAGNCDAQFRWNDDPGYIQTKDMYGSFVADSSGKHPGIYTVLGGPPNDWTHQTVDFNLRQLPNTTDYRYSAFDKASIMMYSFPDWMFVNGSASSCYTGENLTLSAADEQVALAAYPRDTRAAVASSLKNVMAIQLLSTQKKASPDIKAQANARLKSLQ